ncbi:hypothetical protein [Paenibacillus sp. GXUN7292]|uniref:hypothetical protein n=1 Tax=Paenibacillus sp. GXUN7292 TaxID=3422499 RepID=UPI003D7E02DC
MSDDNKSNVDTILEKLQQPLPDSTVSRQQQNPNSLYFKNDVYEWWARKHAGSLFSSEVLMFDVTDRYVKFVVRVFIGDTHHDGVGFKLVEGSTNLTTCVDLAREEAERNAFDMFGFGWHNLNKYGNNRIPVANLNQKCTKCTLPLTEADAEFLKTHTKSNIPYHRNCIPEHLIKNR